MILALCCSIAGSVRSVSGAPVAGSRIVIDGAAAIAATTDADGDFALTQPPGPHRVSATARGYAPLTIAVNGDRDVRVAFALEPLDSPQLRRIGGATVDGGLATIVGTVPSVTLSRASLDALGDDRVVDGLATLPSVTFARPDGGGANAVAAAALRGPDPSESLLALDGQLLSDGNTGDLDLSRLPVAAFSAIDVTEGLVRTIGTAATRSAARSISSRCGRPPPRMRRRRTRSGTSGVPKRGSTRRGRSASSATRRRSTTSRRAASSVRPSRSTRRPTRRAPPARRTLAPRSARAQRLGR